MPQNQLRRWPYLMAGIILFLFPGIIYSWSLFTISIEAQYGCTRAEASTVFMLSMAMVSIGSVLGGFVAQKKPLLFNIVISAVVMACGFFLSSQTTQIQQLYITYSCPVGFGIGFMYIPIINAVLPWYPEKPGTVSGLLLGSIGVSLLILGTPIAYLFRTYGASGTFVILGLTIPPVMVLAALVIKTAPLNTTISKENTELTNKLSIVDDVKTSKIITRRSFWMFMLWQFGLSSSGQAIIGQSATVATSIGASVAVATLAASGLSIADGISRCIWGMLCDRFGLATVRILTNLTMVTGIILCLLALNSSNVLLLVIGFITVGAAYGGATSHVPAFLREMYGVTYYASNYALFFISGPARAIVGTSLIVAGYTHSGYFFALLLMLVLSLFGIFFSFFIGKK